MFFGLFGGKEEDKERVANEKKEQNLSPTPHSDVNSVTPKSVANMSDKIAQYQNEIVVIEERKRALLATDNVASGIYKKYSLFLEVLDAADELIRELNEYILSPYTPDRLRYDVITRSNILHARKAYSATNVDDILSFYDIIYKASNLDKEVQKINQNIDKLSADKLYEEEVAPLLAQQSAALNMDKISVKKMLYSAAKIMAKMSIENINYAEHRASLTQFIKVLSGYIDNFIFEDAGKYFNLYEEEFFYHPNSIPTRVIVFKKFGLGQLSEMAIKTTVAAAKKFNNMRLLQGLLDHKDQLSNIFKSTVEFDYPDSTIKLYDEQIKPNSSAQDVFEQSLINQIASNFEATKQRILDIDNKLISLDDSFKKICEDEGYIEYEYQRMKKAEEETCEMKPEDALRLPTHPAEVYFKLLHKNQYKEFQTMHDKMIRIMRRLVKNRAIYNKLLQIMGVKN